MIVKSLVFLSVALIASCESARILGIFPMAGISHQILASKLMKGLAEAGHDITMVSPYALKDLPKNGTYTEIVLDGLADNFNELLRQFDVLHNDDSTLKQFQMMTSFLTDAVNKTLNWPELKRLKDSGATFDLLMSEYFLSDAMHVFADIFDCPLILLSSQGATPWINSLVANPQPVSYIAHQSFDDIPQTLSFMDRAKNLFFYIMNHCMFNLYLIPKQNALVQEAYPNSRSLDEILDRVALIFLNSHISSNEAVPLVPNMVEIGGYFVDPPKKLPKDLQDFMDGATEGVIYFSLGSNIKGKDMTAERKQLFMNIFGRLKQKVIWKFEEDLPNKPPNVLIQKWCPQQDILAHPNMKLFITHGGLLSTTETIYHGVPILAIPVFADQPQNAARAVSRGFGLSISYHDSNFTEERVDSMVNELLHNLQYRDNVKTRSELYHDRPMKPMETAVYWAEYVIRHHGAPHLMVAGAKLPWYKYYMLDIIAFLLITRALFLYILKFAIGKLIAWCRTKKIKAD